jgi:hypothetical protein
MEEAGFANALAINYQSTRSHIPEDLNHHQHHGKNLKAHKTGLYPLSLHLNKKKKKLTLKTLWFLYKELGQKISK